jgi:glycosyltransferase involved in cell wall biosynthesis
MEMENPQLRLAWGGAAPALLVTSMYTEGDLVRRLGRDAYSYRYVWRAFAPLLQRWAPTEEVSGPRSHIEQAAQRIHREGRTPIHLSFLPLHLMELLPGVPNVAVPAWEFPEIPATDQGGDPRMNWARVAAELDSLITHTHYSRNAFLRAGVRTPVHVVPVPVRPEYFDVAGWQPDQQMVLDCPCYVFPQPAELPRPARRWVGSDTGHLPSRPGLRQLCKKAIGALPPRLSNAALRAARATRAAAWAAREALGEVDVRRLYPPQPRLHLSGIVYSTILNPRDPRKNWLDLLTAFLLALGDCADATLVVKLVVSAQTEADVLREVFADYRGTGLAHRCRLVFISAYLSDAQLVRLAQASTFYLNASHAEGSCLPLQDFLAAGRPAVAPPNTGMADALDTDCAFLVDSHPEPARSPLDPDGPLATRWHRIVWQSLYEQVRASYETARGDVGRYHRLAEAARGRMTALAGREAVWPRLAAALDDVCRPDRLPRRAG